MRNICAVLTMLLLVVIQPLYATQPQYLPVTGVTAIPARVQGLDITISALVLHADFGLNVSKVSFYAVNTSGTPYGRVRFGLYYVSGTGEFLGADIFPAPVTAMQPGKRNLISVSVARTFNPGTKVIAVVNHASSATEEFAVRGAAIRCALALGQSPLIIEPQPPKPTELLKEKKLSQLALGDPQILCDPSFCSECLFNARETCDSGVKSYACSIGNCSCQFTCR